MKIKDIDGHFFQWKSAAQRMSYLHAKGFLKDGKKTGASIIPVVVVEAMDTLVASLPGSG